MRILLLDKEILVGSAYFYNTGYSKNCRNNVASNSATSSDFLSEMRKSVDYIEKVTGLIKDTETQCVP